MKVHSFICQTPADALAQIHSQLGPEAVVLSVRPLPGNPLTRLWQKGRGMEVLAAILDPGTPRPDESSAAAVAPAQSDLRSELESTATFSLPLYDGSNRPHVFVGPAGVGKTTLLCKWMTRAALQEQRLVRVWRLDGATANTSEFLNVYCEMLGLGIERVWNPPMPALRLGDQPGSTADPNDPASPVLLVDLPGVAANDPVAFQELKHQISRLPNPRVHLVLNAAYDLDLLREQCRLFAALNPEDLSLSHLDEQRRSGKIKELLRGINCSIRFLSTGQKIPGDFAQLGDPHPPRFAVLA